ncbi:MAG: addiction module protein [Nitrosomonadales bacterium]
MGALEIVTLALKLDPADRFELVDHVLHSLDRPYPAIDRIWQDEAVRRLAAHRSGKVQGIPTEEIFGKF